MLQAHIERALHDHFLFRKLTDSQRHVLLDCMQRIEVQPGDTVVKQVSFLIFSYSFVATILFNSDVVPLLHEQTCLEITLLLRCYHVSYE